MTRAGLKQLSLVDWLDLTVEEMKIIRELVEQLEGIPVFVLRLLDLSLTVSEVSQEDSQDEDRTSLK